MFGNIPTYHLLDMIDELLLAEMDLETEDEINLELESRIPQEYLEEESEWAK